jgi:hypothetical protein
MCSVLLPPGVYPIAVNKYININNIMADVASKQQTTALFLSTIVTRTRKHTELTKYLPRFESTTKDNEA